MMAEDGGGAVFETVIAAIDVVGMVGTDVLVVVVVGVEDDNFIEVGGISAFKFGMVDAPPLPRFFFTFLA